jgi:glutamate-1-semialdehyde 2,1-aminomutase
MDGQRIRELTEREDERFAERTRASEAMYRRASRVLAGGVTSSFHGREPSPVYVARGEGARVWDVDGNEYVDFHNGFSAMVQGHAHPAIRAAVSRRHELGTHFGATTEDSVAVAEELTRRFGLPRWRFANSGTEANVAAIRLARAFTGREGVLKMAGAYHGHADIAHLHEVEWGDTRALEAAIAEQRPACVIMEGAMTSLGLVLPEPGYLAAVRELTRSDGVVLILNEVKTGLTIAAGGAVERLGAEPDVVTLAKSLGGGLPSGAVGMTVELAELVEDGRLRLLGTFNGNPLSMAAASASLHEVLTPAAYEELERLGARMVAGCEQVIAAGGLEAQCVGLGSKGCVRWGGQPELTRLIWTWLMNRGVFTTFGREQEWLPHPRRLGEDQLHPVGAAAVRRAGRAAAAHRRRDLPLDRQPRAGLAGRGARGAGRAPVHRARGPERGRPLAHRRRHARDDDVHPVRAARRGGLARGRARGLRPAVLRHRRRARAERPRRARALRGARSTGPRAHLRPCRRVDLPGRAGPRPDGVHAALSPTRHPCTASTCAAPAPTPAAG